MDEKLAVRPFDYLILGGGSTGVASAHSLIKWARVLVLDVEKGKVDVLIDEGVDAIVGDAGDEELLKTLLAYKPKGVLIFTNDAEANMQALSVVRRERPETYVICRAMGPSNEQELYERGADMVVLPAKFIADIVSNRIEEIERESKAKKLIEVIKQATGKIAIVIHDNPDPDAISSAAAFSEIVANTGLESDVIYGGVISPNGNRALVNLLDIEMFHLAEIHLSDYSMLIALDFQPQHNTSIPPETKFDVVIDHHKSDEKVEAKFVDVRIDAGATASIVCEYLRELNIAPSSKIASAMLHGILIDTRVFRTHTSALDF